MTCMDDAGGQHADQLTHCPLPVDAVPWLRLFPGEERQLGVMRQWLASLLGDDPARADVASVATELGGNAIRHTASGQGGWFAVGITWHRPFLRIAVADGGAPGEPRVIDNSDDEHGRGLKIVRGLSVRAGVLGDHYGRVVWADIRSDHERAPWPDPGPSAGPASPPVQGGLTMTDGHPDQYAGIAASVGLDDVTARELDRLSATYPPFRFSHKPVGPRGPRWIAQRKDSAAPGLHTVITADLAELCEALTSDQA